MTVLLDNSTRERGHRRLKASILTASSVDDGAIATMFKLYSRYYGGTSRDLFEHDLRGKDRVLLLQTETEQLAGFSTLALMDLELPGGPARAIFSGDTIIDRDYWGTQALSFSWIRLAGEIKAQAPEQPLFWFLIVKGHRTYRYLSAFSIDFFPRWNAPTPPWAKAVMDGLAHRRFGACYDAERGIVSFPQSRGHLKSEWTAIEPDEQSRPDVAFFLARNPGYTRGDELVCLTELSLQNLQPLARRIFKQGLAA